MVDLLWNILNCNPCAYDCRLRTAVFRLYHTIWGIDEPSCLAHRPSSSPVRSLTDEVKSEEERLQRAIAEAEEERAKKEEEERARKEHEQKAKDM